MRAPSARAQRTRLAERCLRASKASSTANRNRDMGLPAARITDMHVCPMVTGVVPHVGGPILPPCATTVLIGGLPAARVTDMALCVGPTDVIALGSFICLIKGLPAARITDMTVHGGVIVVGCVTVLIS